MLSAPTEQESKENFLAILNENQTSKKPGREMWVYVKDKHTGEVLGASNFDAFPAAEGHDINGTCQGIYLFVAEKYRRQRLYSKLIELREKAAAEYLKDIGRIKDVSEARICTFAEQNNALMMTPAQYIEDSEAAIDQCVRRSIFERPIRKSDESDIRMPGSRTLQMRYVQPPLEAGGEVCDYLDYVVKMPDDRSTIPADVVRGHLQRFFEKSFPPGTSLDAPELVGMKRDLALHQEIPLDPEGKFDSLSKKLDVDCAKKLHDMDKHENKRIGELRPDLVASHYGDGVTLEMAMDGYHRIEGRGGHTPPAAPRAAPGGWAQSIKADKPHSRHL